MAQTEEKAPAVETVDAVLKDLLENLEGSLDKFEDAAAERYGATWERAGQDVRQVLPYLIRRVREVREAVKAT